jgi:hypothetical protein
MSESAPILIAVIAYRSKVLWVSGVSSLDWALKLMSSCMGENSVEFKAV